MDSVTLLHRARDVGLRIETAGNMLRITGPRKAEPVVKLLAQHKAEVMAALATTAHEAKLLTPSPQFERVAVLAEDEPRLEMPCAGRRGRVQELDRAFLHFCCRCGRFAAFGYGVHLRGGHLGRWYCGAHRPHGSPYTGRKSKSGQGNYTID